MGAEHSQPRERRPRKKDNVEEQVIRINRSDPDVPEEYKVVQVSESVIQQVRKIDNNEKGQQLSNELTLQLEENKRLREQMEELKAKREMEALIDAVMAVPAPTSIPQQKMDGLDIDEKKRIFDETAQRVEQRFFSRQYPNACADNQKTILQCLGENPNNPLQCQNLLATYNQCISNFRSTLLNSE